MARKFRELIEAMPAERRACIDVETALLEAEMRLRELRNARDLSQSDLADALQTDQGNVSRLEQQADMYVSTLRRYIAALGGTLEIVAHFPDRDVRITQFRELRRPPSR